jgi:hypothetical protein
MAGLGRAGDEIEVVGGSLGADRQGAELEGAVTTVCVADRDLVLLAGECRGS